MEIHDENYEKEGLHFGGEPQESFIVQRLYNLSNEEFNILISKEHPMRAWALSMGLGVYVPLFMCVGKYAYNKYDNKSARVENWEWVSLIIIIVLSIVLYSIASFFPSDKKKSIKNIQSFFKSQKPFFMTNRRDMKK